MILYGILAPTLTCCSLIVPYNSMSALITLLCIAWFTKEFSLMNCEFWYFIDFPVSSIYQLHNMYEKVPNVCHMNNARKLCRKDRGRGRRDTSSHLTSPSLGVTCTSTLYYSISEVGTYSFKEVLMNAVE